MKTDELYDNVQETKTAFVVTLLVAVYCVSMIIKFIDAHEKWKIICSGIGLSIVSVIGIILIARLIDLKKAGKEIFNDIS